jgi:hypothetical protein
MAYIIKRDYEYEKVNRKEFLRLKEKGFDFKLVCKIIESKTFSKHLEDVNAKIIYHIYKCENGMTFIEKEAIGYLLSYSMLIKSVNDFDEIDDFETANESFKASYQHYKEMLKRIKKLKEIE